MNTPVELTLKLTVAQINAIAGLLQQAPYHLAAPILASMEYQINAQQTAPAVPQQATPVVAPQE